MIDIDSSESISMIDIEPIDINESILSNQSVDFRPRIFCFPIIHHISIFSTHARRVYYSNK